MSAHDPVTRYAEKVVAGDVPAGTLHQLAAARHLKDMADPRGYYFDRVAARHATEFFPACLRHAKGE